MVKDSAWVAVPVAESVTFKVKEAGPEDVGVPVTAPVDGLRMSPAGSVPALTDQV
jgi:hypothetical protein